MTPRLTLAAAASPGVGGQGRNLCDMVSALRDQFDIELFASSRHADVPTHVVPRSRLATVLDRTPGLRRRRDWSGLASSRAFDRFVARRVAPTDLFQGVAGQCTEAMQSARGIGASVALDCITTHVDNFAEHVARESAAFGLRPALHPQTRARMIEAYQAADVIRVMSPHAAATFLDRGFRPEHLVVVPPVVDLRQFEPASLQGDTFRVCCTARLEPWKGFQYLVDAYESLALADSELVLWGAPGSRPVAQWLARRCARTPSIKLRPVEIAAVGYHEAYGRATVFVHPSLADAYSYSVVEAMASGLAVIVTDTTGAAELIADGHSGYVVPPGDAEAIADRLHHLAENPAAVRRMGAAARAAVGRLTPAAFRARWVPALSGLLG